MKKKQKFESSYEFLKGDRMFVLTNLKSGKRVEFSSPQAAMKAGYVK